MDMSEGIHEECGVFGMFSTEPREIARDIYYGLYALQHRGQESCGIVVCDDGLFHFHKDAGGVGDVFNDDELARFPVGTMGVGHVRYSTTGRDLRANCQPMQVNHQKGKMALAHNGNISNSYELRTELELNGAIFHSTSDTEIIAYLVTQARLVKPSIEEALITAMDRLEGAYSIVLMSASKLIAVRDPRGFRPLCIGSCPDGSYVVSSESCALDAVGASFERDVCPGEVIVISGSGKNITLKSYKEHCDKYAKKTCIFEYIYFARPDSVIDGISVHEARVKSGRILAENDRPLEADVVIGVPDSGIDAALGYAEASGIPYGQGFVKNKYIGRTFISPTQDERTDQVRIKLNPIKKTVEGKRVILVDDSIVRGTTSGRIVKLLRDAGAAKIHVRISAPPFIAPCYYGTDIDSKENLIAVNHSPDEIAGMIGADSLKYLPTDSLHELIGCRDYCDACFGGMYPTRIPDNTSKDRFEKRLSER